MMMMIYGPFPPLLLSGLEISGGEFFCFLVF